MTNEKVTPASPDSTSQEIIKTTEALGSALVAEAMKRHEDNIREGVLKDVTRLIQMRDESTEKAEFFTRAAAWYAKKLAALQAGEFTFNERTGEIVPNDAELRRANY